MNLMVAGPFSGDGPCEPSVNALNYRGDSCMNLTMAKSGYTLNYRGDSCMNLSHCHTEAWAGKGITFVFEHMSIGVLGVEIECLANGGWALGRTKG